jgi:hypothetical protein
MKDNKIVKAYWTAWRWPEVYSDDRWVIWMSRIIAIVIPLGLIGLAFLSGLPLLGLALSGILASVFGFTIIAVTIKLFYQEYPAVEKFDEHEARVKQFFHGFPAITDVPLIELEPGVWVAYGHVEETQFATAIRSVILAVTENPEEVFPFENIEKSVGHLYATFKNPAEGHWDEGLDLCKHTTENCFPITRVEI